MVRSFWKVLSGCEKVVRSFRKVVRSFSDGAAVGNSRGTVGSNGGAVGEERRDDGAQRQNRCLRRNEVKGGEGNGGFGVGNNGTERGCGGFFIFNLSFLIFHRGSVEKKWEGETGKWRHCGGGMAGLGDCKLL